ncbi:helix-turn-helix domain-containing protein [Mesorhizobium qingshengii]
MRMRAEGKSVSDTVAALGISRASVFRIRAEHAEAAPTS